MTDRKILRFAQNDRSGGHGRTVSGRKGGRIVCTVRAGQTICAGICVAAVAVMVTACAGGAGHAGDAQDARQTRDARQAPLIGISTACDDSTMVIRLQKTYTDAVLAAGGIPAVLPTVLDAQDAALVTARMDGIIFSGGEDVAPRRYGEEELPQNGKVSPVRDSCEMLYLQAALDAGLHIMGICRGCQLINVALGGSLYQDIPTQRPSAVIHRQTLPGWEPVHKVGLAPDGLLRETLPDTQGDSVWVNSFHHQAVKALAPGLKVTATAEDGIIEAYENADRSIVGVQFHPEKFIAHGDTLWLPLIRSFVEGCSGAAH